jgi:polyisoprenoid-binding protein YceI
MQMLAQSMASVNANRNYNYHLKQYKKFKTMATSKWTLDPTHSEIQFKVKHLMISTVTGSFKQFEGSVEIEGEDLTTAKVRFTADVNSIFTNNEQRDAHLKANDFFDAENHPQLIFESDKLEKIDDEEYKLYGTLTLRGNSKRIALDVDFGGFAQDPWGNARAGFSVKGKINRKDFGVSFSMVSETGGVLLGEEVKLQAEVQFVKQANAVAA